MPQTLLALLALTLASAFSFTSFQRYAQIERNLIRLEISEMAGAIAKEAMVVILNTDFGDGDFGSDNRCAQFFTSATVVCDDLDDFHNMETAIRSFDLSGDAFDFRVNVQVEYRDEINPDSVAGGTTNIQAVLVSVQDIGAQFLVQPITLVQLDKEL